jgi:hypothetical protein
MINKIFYFLLNLAFNAAVDHTVQLYSMSCQISPILAVTYRTLRCSISLVYHWHLDII